VYIHIIRLTCFYFFTSDINLLILFLEKRWIKKNRNVYNHSKHYDIFQLVTIETI